MFKISLGVWKRAINIRNWQIFVIPLVMHAVKQLMQQMPWAYFFMRYIFSFA